MVNVSTSQFQQFCSYQIESLRLEYKDITEQDPDVESVVVRVRRVLTSIARLAGSTPASVGESPKWAAIFQNMVDTRRKLRHILKGKLLYSALYGVYTVMLHDLIAVTKDNAAKGETVKTTITGRPSLEEFREERRRKRESTDDVDIRAKKPATSTTGVNDAQLQSTDEFPTRNVFAPLRPIEMEAVHGDKADDSTEAQQQQTPSSQAGRSPPIVLTSEVNLIQNGEENNFVHFHDKTFCIFNLHYVRKIMSVR
jgi:hypothetical protein